MDQTATTATAQCARAYLLGVWAPSRSSRIASVSELKRDGYAFNLRLLWTHAQSSW